MPKKTGQKYPIDVERISTKIHAFAEQKSLELVNIDRDNFTKDSTQHTQQQPKIQTQKQKRQPCTTNTMSKYDQKNREEKTN